MNYHIVIPIIILHRVNAWFRCNILFDYIYTRGKEYLKNVIEYFFPFLLIENERSIDAKLGDDDNASLCLLRLCSKYAREKKNYTYLLSGKHLTPVETRAIHINAHYAKVITELVGWKFTFRGYRRIRTAGI